MPSWTLSTVSCLCNKNLCLRENEVGHIYRVSWIILRLEHLYTVFLQSADALRPGYAAALSGNMRHPAELWRACLHTGVSQRRLSAVPAAGPTGWVWLSRTEKKYQDCGRYCYISVYFQCVIVALPTAKLCAGQIKRDLMVLAIFPVEISAECKHER